MKNSIFFLAFLFSVSISWCQELYDWSDYKEYFASRKGQLDPIEGLYINWETLKMNSNSGNVEGSPFNCAIISIGDNFECYYFDKNGQRLYSASKLYFYRIGGDKYYAKYYSIQCNKNVYSEHFSINNGCLTFSILFTQAVECIQKFYSPGYLFYAFSKI